MMSTSSVEKGECTLHGRKKTYEKPEIKRVDLALEETLSAGCKLAGDCDDPFDPASEPGS